MASEAPPKRAVVICQEIAESRLDPIVALKQSPHLTDAERKKLLAASSSDLERALGMGAKVWERPDYSPTLADAGQIPQALWVRGNPSALHAPTVAIVGTRSATTYGKAVAQKFAERLAKCGVTIISGGALGIDHAAHTGALQAGGKTAAVMATGIEGTYPHNHRGLFQQIAETGCLISQFACGTKPDHYRFLQRNQLIAALSDAVLVVEAPEVSGALRTAGAAADLNRMVFVVPGNISLTNFRGSHALIRDGAMLVDHPDQVLETLGIEGGPTEEALIEDLPAPQRAIIAVLGDDPISSEVIVDKTGLDVSVVSSELTLLELDGIILRDGIGYARKP
ncbi:MAG: DNA-protecting protein DprA [Chthonomonas sp.]|nr:DNA-protecting protein DprA [Chthonomonas sp.]